MTATNPNQHGLRFSLRPLFILTTVACVSVCFVMNQVQRHEFIRTHTANMAVKRVGFEMPRKHFGRIYHASAPVMLEVRESEFAEAKRLFPDAEWMK